MLVGLSRRELCVAKANTAEAEVKVLIGNNELKRAREAGWAAEGQSNAIKGLLWGVAESCVASTQFARRRQWKITADILEGTRQRSFAKFQDMQITVLKIAVSVVHSQHVLLCLKWLVAGSCRRTSLWIVCCG
jgi:hypothetical protein